MVVNATNGQPVNGQPIIVEPSWYQLAKTSIVPIALVVSPVYYLISKISEAMQYSQERLGYCQKVTARYELINGTTFLASSAMMLYVVIKMIGAQLAAAVAGAYIGVIALAGVSAVMLNHAIYHAGMSSSYPLLLSNA